MNTVTVRNTMLGAGRPKICVPLVAADSDGLHAALAAVRQVPFDVVEFRADFFAEADNIDFVMARLEEARAALPDAPLLFTFRRAEEGGECPVPQDVYFAMIQTAVRSGLADIADIELFAGEAQVKETVALAQSCGVAALLCNHDFRQTPPKEEIVGRLKTMQDWGADVCKIAVMPQSAADVLTLLDATQTMYRRHARQPLVTMAMGRLGTVSRIAGETFGSAMTFGTAGRASAPGQIHAADLRRILDVLSEQPN